MPLHPSSSWRSVNINLLERPLHFVCLCQRRRTGGRSYSSYKICYPVVSRFKNIYPSLESSSTRYPCDAGAHFVFIEGFFLARIPQLNILVSDIEKYHDEWPLDLDSSLPTIMKGETVQQAAPVPVPEPHALIPLTVFDRLYHRTTFVMGWLVEGQIDAAALEGALARLTRKWRILAGRIEPFNDKVNHPIAAAPLVVSTDLCSSGGTMAR